VSVQLAQLIVNAGGMAAMVDYVGDTCGNIRLPGIMMLGYVAAHSENLAMAVIVSKVLSLALRDCNPRIPYPGPFFNPEIPGL